MTEIRANWNSFLPTERVVSRQQVLRPGRILKLDKCLSYETCPDAINYCRRRRPRAASSKRVIQTTSSHLTHHRKKAKKISLSNWKLTTWSLIIFLSIFKRLAEREVKMTIRLRIKVKQTHEVSLKFLLSLASSCDWLQFASSRDDCDSS